jgi:S1-C subfamily serine protease
MSSIRGPFLIGIVILVVVLVAGSSFALGQTFGGKTTTFTSKVTETSTTTATVGNPTETITSTASTTITTTLSSQTGTYTSTATITQILNEVNVSAIFLKAYSSVFQVNIYDSNFNQLGLGSGFLYDSNNHIVTNYHVVEGATYFEIQTYDGQWIEATLKGGDPYADLAVLEANTPLAVKPLKLASRVKIGERAFAIGSPFGLVGSITAGIVSQVNRTGITVVPMLQTDAAINPGNSGGPLLNDACEVLGVNTAGISANMSESIGFAIPYGMIERVIPKLIESGEYKHPFIGIGGEYLDPISAAYYNLPSSLTSGYIITDIISGTAASRSNLRVGDVVIKMDNYNIRKDPDINYLMTYVYSPNDSVTFTVIRNKNQVQIQLTLGVRGG